MGLFGFLKSKERDPITYRLVWFELQVAPFTYRFAIMPEQPILIGLEGENGEQGATMLIRYDHVPEVYEQTVERVDALVQEHGILSLPLKNPQLAFADEALDHASVHIRIAYADDRRWASVFEVDDLPPEIASLIRETKELARQTMETGSNETITGNEARGHLDPERNAAQKESPEVIVKIRVGLSGKIFVDNQEVSLSELGPILDELKSQKGGVWYFRESPEQDPSESTWKIVEKVLDEVARRELPISLQQEEI